MRRLQRKLHERFQKRLQKRRGQCFYSIDDYKGGDPMIIRAIAPLRISFSGGGTDVEPYLSEFGGEVLCSSINLYAHANLETREDEKIILASHDVGYSVEAWKSDSPIEGDLKLLQACVKCCSLAGILPKSGFKLLTHSDALPGSGLGSSSALAVAIIGVIMEAKKREHPKREIAQMAVTAERIIAGIKGGLQDQYAASFGGFNRITFEKEVIVYPTFPDHTTLLELEANLLLCHTGQSRSDLGVIDDQVSRVKEREEGSLNSLHRLKALCSEMEDILHERDLVEFGLALERAWMVKRELSPLISNSHIDDLYETAKKHGAIGGKLLGAGGGGHLLFFVPPESRREVKYHLAEMGANFVPFQFTSDGLQTWRKF